MILLLEITLEMGLPLQFDGNISTADGDISTKTFVLMGTSLQNAMGRPLHQIAVAHRLVPRPTVEMFPSARIQDGLLKWVVNAIGFLLHDIGIQQTLYRIWFRGRERRPQSRFCAERAESAAHQTKKLVSQNSFKILKLF